MIKKYLILLIMVLLLVSCDNFSANTTIAPNSSNESTLRSYTVIFETNGGSSIGSVVVEEGNLLSRPPNPTKEGYGFSTWYTDSLFTYEFNFNLPIYEDTTIYAKWIERFYSLTINDYDGSVYFTGDYGYNVDINEILSAETPLVIGYDFSGWDQDLAGRMPEENVILNPLYEMVSDSLQTFHIFDKTIVKISTNSYSNAALADDGTLYMWGRNWMPGTLCGVYNPEYDTLSPNDITNQFDLNEQEQIIDVYLGASYNYALTNQNRMFKWGGCNQCNLCMCDETDEGYPKDVSTQLGLDELSETDGISSISYYQNQMGILTEENRVFAMGYNGRGALGYGTFDYDDYYYETIETTGYFNLNQGETISLLRFSSAHSSALTSDGRLLMWGANHYGELGDLTTDNKNIPTDVTMNIPLLTDETIIDVELGNNSTAVLTNLGRVFTFGYNGLGQLGDGSKENSLNPIDITANFALNESEQIIDLITQGSSANLALTNQGKLFGWGYNNAGMMGYVSEDYVTTPINITNYLNYDPDTTYQIIIGFDSLLMITEDGIVISGNKTFGLTLDDLIVN